MTTIREAHSELTKMMIDAHMPVSLPVEFEEEEREVAITKIT
jgi:hypothetical protein